MGKTGVTGVKATVRGKRGFGPLKVSESRKIILSINQQVPYILFVIHNHSSVDKSIGYDKLIPHYYQKDNMHQIGL